MANEFYQLCMRRYSINPKNFSREGEAGSYASSRHHTSDFVPNPDAIIWLWGKTISCSVLLLNPLDQTTHSHSFCSSYLIFGIHPASFPLHRCQIQTITPFTDSSYRKGLFQCYSRNPYKVKFSSTASRKKSSTMIKRSWWLVDPPSWLNLLHRQEKRNS